MLRMQTRCVRRWMILSHRPSIAMFTSLPLVVTLLRYLCIFLRSTSSNKTHIMLTYLCLAPNAYSFPDPHKQKSAPTPQAGSAGGSSKGKKFAECYKTGKTVSNFAAHRRLSLLGIDMYTARFVLTHRLVAFSSCHLPVARRGCLRGREAGHQKEYVGILCHQDCDQGQAD